MFIAICGIDGSGKTTQVNFLKEYYQNKGRNITCIKQHTQTYKNDQRMYDYLHGNLTKSELLVSEMALLSAFDRMRQYQLEILPRIKNNEIVIVDRYVYSAYAYYIMRGLELNWILDLNKKLPLPDCTICIDVPAEIAYERIKKRQDITLEESNQKYMEKIRKIYRDQPWGKSSNYYIVNGDDNIHNISNKISNITNMYL